MIEMVCPKCKTDNTYNIRYRRSKHLLCGIAKEHFHAKCWRCKCRWVKLMEDVEDD